MRQLAAAARRVGVSRWRFLGSVRGQPSTASRSCARTGRPSSEALPRTQPSRTRWTRRTRTDHQPVGAGGASRATPSATAPGACATCCARLGHQSDLFALTIDDDLRDDVRPFADPAARRGDVTIFHFALPSPMTEAFASLPRGRVLQYHNITPAQFFAPVRPGAVPARRRSAARSWRRWPAASISRSAIPSTTGASSKRSASRPPA